MTDYKYYIPTGWSILEQCIHKIEGWLRGATSLGDGPFRDHIFIKIEVSEGCNVPR